MPRMHPVDGIRQVQTKAGFAADSIPKLAAAPEKFLGFAVDFMTHGPGCTRVMVPAFFIVNTVSNGRPKWVG